MAYDIKTLSYMKRHWLLHTSNIPHRFLGLDPSDVKTQTGAFPPQIDRWVKKVLEGKVVKSIGGISTTGVGLLFDGAPGLGKTTHSVLCLTELVRQLPEDMMHAKRILGYVGDDFGVTSRPVYYMTVPDFISRKKSMIDMDPESRREMALQMEGFHGRSKMDHLNVRVLVLDDLGKELNTDYNTAGFDELLRARYDKGLPTIVTTNLSREAWGDKYGKAMGSFVYEAFKHVIIGTKDLRRN